MMEPIMSNNSPSQVTRERLIAEMDHELFRVGNHPSLGIDPELVRRWRDALVAAHVASTPPHEDEDQPDEIEAALKAQSPAAGRVPSSGEQATCPAPENLEEAVRVVLETFRRDEAQGYRSRDRQFAIEVLSRAMSAPPASGNQTTAS